MEKLIRFLQKLFADKFYGIISVKVYNGNAPQVEMNSLRKWAYKDLPNDWM